MESNSATSNVNNNFTCTSCQCHLAGERFIYREKEKINFCVGCYEERFSNTCNKCNEKIRTDSKDVGYQERHWHEKCFVCVQCKAPLIEKLFGTRDSETGGPSTLYCDDCYDNLFGIKCSTCRQPFKAGMKKLDWNGCQWHEECFKCTNCSCVIGNNSFLPRDNQPFCVQCFNNLFAPNCSYCNKAVMSGGVLYKNEPYHRECLKCFHCNRSVHNVKFTSRADKPYCLPCHGELFARKCTECSTPIIGPGGRQVKFTSFDDRHWHNECFKCACSNCGQVNLAGKGFVLDAELVLCPNCARLPLQKRNYVTNSEKKEKLETKMKDEKHQN